MMPAVCGIKGCFNRRGIHRGVKYFKTPAILTREGEETKSLSEERRRLWKRAMNRKDMTTEAQWDRTVVTRRICMIAPTQPGYQLCTLQTSLPGSASSSHTSVHVQRYERAIRRKENRQKAEAAESLLSLKCNKLDFSNQVSCNLNINTVESDHDSSDIFDAHIAIGLDNPTPCTKKLTENESWDKDVQTDYTMHELDQLESDYQARVLESASFSTLAKKNLYSFDYYMASNTASFYTGHPNVQVLKTVFMIIEAYMLECNSMSNEQQFLVCLVKLRMNCLFQDIANDLHVSISTIQRSFHSTLNVLYERLDFLISLPEREDLHISMPMCFREKFGEKVVVVLDCFELFIERPSSQMNKVHTYSKYKHHQIMKYLIGVSPQGVITFISDGRGGRTSDKHITENCGILNNILPGDCVMVDRGFNIAEAVNFQQAELAIPSFTPSPVTRGKTQLHPLEVENTGRIASVRIRVERVIGLILREFRIFGGIIPVEFVKLRVNETVPTIDKVVKVACCLTNLCGSVVPFE